MTLWHVFQISLPYSEFRLCNRQCCGYGYGCGYMFRMNVSILNSNLWKYSALVMFGQRRKRSTDNWQGGLLAKASQRWLQLVMFTNQNQINIFIYKLIHIFYAYFIHIKENTVPAPGGCLPSTNNVLCPHKTNFQMPSWRKWREVSIILRLGKQIKHSIIFCFNVSYCFLFLIHTLLHYVPL